jgi:hypothetical protein
MEMWNKIKSIKGIKHQQLSPNIRFNNNTLLLSLDIAEAFAQHFKKKKQRLLKLQSRVYKLQKYC